MSNKKIIMLTFFIIIGMIIIPTIYKVYQEHNHKLIVVVEKEFEYYANLCYKEEKCRTIVYLKDLYKNNYIEEKLTDPINKKYYAEESYVNIESKEIKLIS